MWTEFNKNEMHYRPKVRYWIPSAMVELDDIRKNVRDLKARGFGSIELVSFMPFSNPFPEEGYQWGSKRWLKVLEVLLDEAKKMECMLT